MGFAGIRAARGLSGGDLDILLLDRTNYHLFQPLLYQVATAGLEEEAIAYPIRSIIRGWKNVTFRRCEVTGLDLEGRTVITNRGAFGYDYLVLAGGSVTNYFGNAGIASQAFDLKSLADADKLRNSILCAFEEAVCEEDPQRRKELLTFVVVGGGPTGVEFAGALSELVQYILSKDYTSIDSADSRVILLEASASILTAMPERLQNYAIQKLQEMGVEVRCNTRVADAAPGKVLLTNGETITADTLFWSAGVKASPLADMLDCAKGAGGRIIVEPGLTIAGHDEVYVTGDMACCMDNGSALPMMAPVAMQQGRHAARAILAREQGMPAPAFKFIDKGAMATIGRNSAVAAAHGFNVSGYAAWLAWLLLHLYYLVGFHNRIIVMLNWAWYYWFHERQISLITSTPGQDTFKQGS
jgi:NADH dehydrogenase